MSQVDGAAVSAAVAAAVSPGATIRRRRFVILGRRSPWRTRLLDAMRGTPGCWICAGTASVENIAKRVRRRGDVLRARRQP